MLIHIHLGGPLQWGWITRLSGARFDGAVLSEATTSGTGIDANTIAEESV
jgi:hypothetical protein